jgi:hypothetical protein
MARLLVAIAVGLIDTRSVHRTPGQIPRCRHSLLTIVTVHQPTLHASMLQNSKSVSLTLSDVVDVNSLTLNTEGHGSSSSSEIILTCDTTVPADRCHGSHRSLCCRKLYDS